MSMMSAVRTIARATVAAGAVVALLLPGSLRAQGQTGGGNIEGLVADQTGGLLPGVTVTIQNVATGLSRTMTTDATGGFRAPLLPVGTYLVVAELSGFRSAKAKPTLHIGDTVNLALKLEIGSQDVEVDVLADAPIVDTTRSQQSSTVGERAVANLPVNGRNFIDFVLTTPGVTRDVRLGDISFAGQRGTLNSLIIDGADNNNTFFGQTLGRTGSGRAPYQFSQDAVQEFQVNRNAYSAEYGRAGGAVINVVTKSGTNEFHGSAFEFYRDKTLNAQSWPTKSVTPALAKSPYHFDQFGGSLGGPLAKDKAFFFLSYDGQRNSIPNEINLQQNLGSVSVPPDPASQAGFATVTSKADNWQRAQNQDVFLARVDWSLNAKHRLTVRYNHQNFTGQNFENGGATNSLEHTGDSVVHTRTANASLASVLSPTFFNELRFQLARDEEPGLANSEAPEATVREGGRTVLTIGRNNFSPRETTIKRWQIADTATFVHGAHTLKVGADVNNDAILNFFPGNFSGSYTFSTLAGFNSGRPTNAASGERYVQAFPGTGTTGATTEPDITEFAAFVQDEWRARKTLTFTFGLRYDIQSFAQPQVQNPDPQLAAAGIDTSFLKTDKDNLAPRVGFAWTPSDKWVVRGGYGLFYGRTPSIMVGTAHSNNGINVQTVTFTGALVPTYPAKFDTLPTGAALPKPSIFVFDKDYENPEVHQASLGAEYALNSNVAVGVSYLFVAGRKLQRSRDFNVGTPVATEIPIQGGGSVTIQQFPTVRPLTNFDRIIRFESTAESEYNGLTLELRKRFGGKFQGSLAYTLGKVEDTVPDATAVVPGGGDDAKFASNPADFEADRAPGNNDQRHRLVLSGYWDLTYWNDAQGLRKVLCDGWAISWIAALESGQPYSQAITNDVNRDGNTRNDLVPGSRNSLNTEGRFGIDARLVKRIPLARRIKLELIGEAFNLLNSTNVTLARTGLYTFTSGALVPQANFGQDAGAADPRIVQLAVKLTF